MSKLRIALFAAAATLGLASLAHADDLDTGKHAGAWIINVRGTDVAPNANSAITSNVVTPPPPSTTGSGVRVTSGAATGLNANVSTDFIPSLGISYFFTDRISGELILGTSNHTIKAKGPGVDVTVHKTWVLPPSLTVQYHFMPKNQFSPYLGAGVNYMLFYSGKDYNGFTVKLKNGAGLVLQAGGDYALTKHVNLNVDVKKVFFHTTANINAGALSSSVNLDPWVVSGGLGFKF